MNKKSDFILGKPQKSSSTSGPTTKKALSPPPPLLSLVFTAYF